MTPFGKQIRGWAVVYAFAGALVCTVSLARASTTDVRRFFLYLVCANIAALGLRLTANKSLLSAGLLIVLLGVDDLSLSELLFIAFTITLLRELRGVRRASQILPLLYAIGSVTIGVTLAHAVYEAIPLLPFTALFPAPAIASAFVLLFNCGLATALLREPAVPLIGVYRRDCRPLLPWFVAAAYLAYLVRCASIETGFHPGLIVLPMLFALDRGYRAWSAAKAAHRAELDAVHRRTLETLAVAIDIRDHTTQMRLWRVQVYALAVGRELGLDEEELQSLNVAALLHDIGKLGIPDHILQKPGPLSAEEWEKIKTHPAMGAEMLSRMNYPDSVLAIVQAHHEKWDGTGYPRGLTGEEIPIGARILSAVDCLDALASDRPYRGALPLREAMDEVRAEEGKSYDPKVVSVLERRHAELEQMASAGPGSGLAEKSAEAAEYPQQDLGKLSAKLLAESGATANSIVDPIVSARQESQMLQRLAGDLAHGLRIEEVVSSIHKCLGQMIGYDTLAVYVSRGETLEPVCVVGGNHHLFSRRPFPMAKSLSGWVAQTRSPILNGNACLECCFLNDSAVFYKLQATLAVPFEGRDGLTGVLTLYHPNGNAFSRDNLRVVQAAGVHAGRAIEGALRYQHAEESAITDHLTGIPNARSLAIHLERELARASREQSTVGVLVCDLDGFKQVNDRFGHLKGNEVLQHVANGLRETCRTSDYLARMGGDEFVIVIPGLQEELCSSYENRLLAVAVGAGWAICGEKCLSMSIGTAIYPADGGDPETLFAEADRRMYRVKEGRKGSVSACRNTGEMDPDGLAVS